MFEEFQDGHHGSHLGYQKELILAILNLYVAPVPPSYTSLFKHLLWHTAELASGPRVKLASCKSALNPTVVCSTDRSKAVVPVLVLLFVAL